MWIKLALSKANTDIFKPKSLILVEPFAKLVKSYFSFIKYSFPHPKPGFWWHHWLLPLVLNKILDADQKQGLFVPSLTAGTKKENLFPSFNPGYNK
jgi:hypothetical protein